MANTRQSKKRAVQSEKRRQQNTSSRSNLRTHVKKVVKAIDAKDLETAKRVYQEAVPILDRMATKGLIHKNKAARHKSRLSAHIKFLAAQ